MEAWGGLLESLEICESSNDVEIKIQNLRDKIRSLEACKNFQEIKVQLATFTEEEKNYLNSPLLDEISDTIFFQSPFLHCCLRNKPKALRFYLEREKFLNIDQNESKILKHAVYFKYKEIVKILLENNAKVRTSVLKFSIIKHDLDITTLLFSKLPKHKEKLLDLLQFACELNNAEIVEFFLKQNIRAPDELLTCTIDKNVMKLLIQYGAKINKVADIVLENAAKTGSKELLEFLLENGVDIHTNYDTALIIACENNKPECVEFLLEKGASIRQAEKRALFRAVREGYTDVVKILLEHGAILNNIGGNLFSDAGFNFIVEAADKNKSEILKLLLKYIPVSNDDIDDLMYEILHEHKTESLKVLFEFSLSHQLKR